MTDEQRNKLVKLGQLETFKGLCDSKYQDQAIEIAGLNSETVEGALAELLDAIGNSDITFQKLSTANTGKLATYRFTKGTGAGATTMDIDIEKDLINKTFTLVTITESGGKYYDGSTEVGSTDGVTSTGVYMKYTSGTADSEVTKYANMQGLVEYLTLGTQTGKAVQLDITNHQITADIPAKAIGKSHLSDSVQASLDLADSALQAHQDITGKADKVSSATNGNFAGLDSSGNLTDSGYKATDFQAAGNYKTTQTAVTDPSANGNAIAFIDTISQDTNGVITVTKKNVQLASSSQDGLMSDDDFIKLAALPTNADLNTLLGGKKNVQTAVSDPTANGNAVTFIDTISQNTNGEITVTKKTVSTVVASTSGTGGSAGLMTAAQAEKLNAISYATDLDIQELFA